VRQTADRHPRLQPILANTPPGLTRSDGLFDAGRWWDRVGSAGRSRSKRAGRNVFPPKTKGRWARTSAAQGPLRRRLPSACMNSGRCWMLVAARLRRYRKAVRAVLRREVKLSRRHRQTNGTPDAQPEPDVGVSIRRCIRMRQRDALWISLASLAGLTRFDQRLHDRCPRSIQATLAEGKTH